MELEVTVEPVVSMFPTTSHASANSVAIWGNPACTLTSLFVESFPAETTTTPVFWKLFKADR